MAGDAALDGHQGEPALIPRDESCRNTSASPAKTDAGNNTSHTGFQPGAFSDINITAFWWRGQWMPAPRLGRLGFPREHQRWDRERVTIHYENIKSGPGMIARLDTADELARVHDALRLPVHHALSRLLDIGAGIGMPMAMAAARAQ